jgi:ribonuclease VapC
VVLSSTVRRFRSGNYSLGGGYLLDSSAVLAVLFDERGAEAEIPLLPAPSIHAVQMAEILNTLKDRGVPEERAARLLEGLAIPVAECFRREDAYYSWRYCRRGLLLGDRICLLTAELAGRTAVTAEHRWQEILDEDPSLPVKVLLIRSRTH